MVKTLCFHCRGHGLHPWSKKFHTPQSAVKKKKNKNILLLPRGEGRKGKYWGKVLVNTTIRYKISHKDILYNMGNIANIL